MSIRSESFKLVELRAKTDRQLLEYTSNRLDAGLASARLGTDPDRARRAFDEARMLMPWLCNIGAADRLRLAGKMNQLREMLDGIAASCLRAAC